MQVSGIKKAPKARQGWQQYCHEKYAEEVAPVVAKEWEEGKASGAIPAGSKQGAQFRAEVARKLFNALPEAVRKEYHERAVEEAKAEKERLERLKKEGPSERPEDRQRLAYSSALQHFSLSNRAIDNLKELLGPLLEGIRARTGCHLLVVVGGPMPNQDGALGTVQ